MRARKASVSAVEVTSPRAIRLPASAMLSVVRSAVLRLLIGAEQVRRFGGPGPTGGNTLHQGDQSGIALVQVLDVLRRKRQACQRGTRTKFLKRWRLLFCHSILPASHMQSTCRLGGPLRRAAGEREGPIAKQWEGEVVPGTSGMLRLLSRRPTSPSPRWRAGPLPLPPR